MDPDLCNLLTNNIDLNEISIWGMPFYACIIVICVLLLVSGLFSASENAYTNCNRYHFQSLANKGNFTAKLVTRLVRKFDNTLVTVLVGNNIVQTIMSFLSAMIFYNICLAFGLSEGVESVLSTIVMAALVYIVSDTVPKILSKTIPNKMAIILAYPVSFVSIILFPITIIFRGVLALVHKIFKVKDQNLLSKEQLMQSVSEAINDEDNVDDENEAEKLFENDETEIIDNVLTFDMRKVRDVYTSKEKVFSLSIDELDYETINSIIIEKDYSRIPIYEDDKDNIIGILVLRLYFEEYTKDKHFPIQSGLEKPVFIDIDTPLDDCFKTLNVEKVHLGIVMENGVNKGIISMDDVLEELVDNIKDEENKDLAKELEDE